MQLTWLLDDYGVPANWRAMEGHSVNTYTMINKEGKETYIKLIWTPKGGKTAARMIFMWVVCSVRCNLSSGVVSIGYGVRYI